MQESKILTIISYSKEVCNCYVHIDSRTEEGSVFWFFRDKKQKLKLCAYCSLILLARKVNKLELYVYATE